MEVKKRERQSNIELLRIFAMLLIVAHHFAVHSGFTFAPNDLSLNSLWIKFIAIGGKLGVNIFVLISGYFMCTQTRFRFYKASLLYSQIFFYSIAVFLLALKLGEPFTTNRLNLALTPVIHEYWWFATSYFIIFIFSPYINQFLNTLSKKQHSSLLILMGVVWSVIYTISGYRLQSNNVVWFLVIYILAAYIRRYMDEEKSPIKLYLLAVGLMFGAYLLYVVSGVLGAKHPWFLGLSGRVYAMESVPMALLAVVIFLAFKNTKIPTLSLINHISATTFGIYLIHDNPLIRAYLWTKWLKPAEHSASSLLIPYSVVCVVGIFVVGAVIESCRLAFFGLWYNKAYNFIKKPIKKRKGG